MRIKMNIGAGFLAVSIMVLSGCATVQIPDLKVATETLADAPVILIQAVDARGTTRMGTIGASTFKLTTADATKVLTSLMQETLYHDRISGDLLPGSSPLSKSQAAQILKKRHAQGLFVLKLISATVESIDLILDEPEYAATIHVDFYDENGALLFSGTYQGKHEARAMTLTGEGKAIVEAIRIAVSRAQSDPEFQEYKQTLLNP